MSKKRIPAELKAAWRALGLEESTIELLGEDWPSYSSEERGLTMTLTILELVATVAERQAARLQSE